VGDILELVLLVGFWFSEINLDDVSDLIDYSDSIDLFD